MNTQLLSDDQITLIVSGIRKNVPSFHKSRAPLASLRFGFVRRHTVSILRRWERIDTSRRNLFRGGPVAYILGVPC